MSLSMHSFVGTDILIVTSFLTAKSSDPDEILNLLELVVGVAVMCEDKNIFIPKIFELNDVSQVIVDCTFFLSIVLRMA